MKPACFLLIVLSISAAFGQSKPAASPIKSTNSPADANLQLAWQYCQQSGTRAMLVMHEGKVVFEQYANGGSATRPQLLASGSKSFNGVLAEAAVEDGLLKLDDRVCDVITEWKNDPQKSQITYRQLLTLTSGLSPGSIRGKLGLAGWNDVLTVPMVSAPGEKFDYGGNHLNAFAAALQRKLRTETYESYLKRRILDPLGITLTWRGRFDDGNPQVAGGGFITARDWATFGEWVRREGNWNGKQIIAKNRLAECFVSTPQNPAYGLTWWLRRPVSPDLIQAIPLLRSEAGPFLSAPNLPDDVVMAAGAGKQRLYIIPSLKLVALRQGPLLTPNAEYTDVEFLNRLLLGKASRQ
ncbi:serine hydrolase domain-containing protein [Spirosoma fluminis]